MQEFILLIHAEENPISLLSPEKQELHIRKVSKFIESLVKAGKLKDGVPLEPSGIIISGKAGAFEMANLHVGNGIVAGYYYLTATDLDEVIKIAKSDPRFEDPGWRIEIRPVLKVQGITQ